MFFLPSASMPHSVTSTHLSPAKKTHKGTATLPLDSAPIHGLPTLRRSTRQPTQAKGSCRSEISSGYQGKVFFIRSPCRVREGLQDIFPLDVGIRCQHLLYRLSRCHHAHYGTDSHPHAPNTGFPSHHLRVHGDAIQLFHDFLHAFGLSIHVHRFI